MNAALLILTILSSLTVALASAVTNAEIISCPG